MREYYFFRAGGNMSEKSELQIMIASIGNSGVQVLALLLTMATFVMVLIACILPFWRRNDLEGEVIETIRRSSGS